MSTATPFDDSVSQLAGRCLGRLAQDSGAFAAAVAAFESRDPDALRWVLQRLELLPHCELICEWIHIKWCVLRCFEVCGLPREHVALPHLPDFVRAVAQLAYNEKQLRRLVDAVSCGNGDKYRAALAELKLEPFCHLLCRWVCAIIYRRVCEIVCTPLRVPPVDPVAEIRAEAAVMARLVANEKAFAEISQAAVAFRCDPLRAAIDGRLRRPVRGHLPRDLQLAVRPGVPRILPAPAHHSHRRTRHRGGARFALAARALASQPRALEDLVRAVQDSDAKAYEDIIARFGLRPTAGRCAPGCARSSATSSASASARRSSSRISSGSATSTTSRRSTVRCRLAD